ncbi:3-hydroxyisobutyrate dehydrogenase-like beta-hydroxyacid dehydrogenase [Herbihabitans rhizosphaerae]|uniref:3-hydroxyisobutyrate dehydrogenase-like beta-hydroxyacid dehydrogenase n=2 Tax=Herbihabitans rhizosphaerae TaxID=1872711 RepID=A0A4Q7KR99_9PSEU|nr:3-hydroxyisobutyrate dehydrogenase-like beta-hydroxyacid dehydrogenase [Herbihabitans rhizosphaerae]
MSDKSVTVIGLGNMGHALATTFLGAGLRTTVWNRTPGKAPSGASEAASAADAVAASPLVVICVADYDAVHQVLDPIAGTLAGRTIVNLTSGTLDQVREMAEFAARHDASYVDGAVLAVAEMVGTTDAQLIYSGPREVYDAHAGVLDVLGEGRHLGEDPGTAEVVDAGLVGSLYLLLAGFLHTAALADTANVTPTEVAGLASKWLVGAMALLPGLAAEIEAGDYTGGALPVGINHWALGAITSVSEQSGVDAEIHRPFRTLLGRQVEAGRSAESIASVFELLRRSA